MENLLFTVNGIFRKKFTLVWYRAPLVKEKVANSLFLYLDWFCWGQRSDETFVDDMLAARLGLGVKSGCTCWAAHASCLRRATAKNTGSCQPLPAARGGERCGDRSDLVTVGFQQPSCVWLLGNAFQTNCPWWRVRPPGVCCVSVSVCACVYMCG